jgi:hypothetical protein
MHSDSGLAWYEKLGLALTTIAVAMKNVWLGWVKHGGGPENVFYEIMDAIVTVAFSAIVGTAMAFFVKMFLRKYFGKEEN